MHDNVTILALKKPDPGEPEAALAGRQRGAHTGKRDIRTSYEAILESKLVYGNGG